MKNQDNLSKISSFQLYLLKNSFKILKLFEGILAIFFNAKKKEIKVFVNY